MLEARSAEWDRSAEEHRASETALREQIDALGRDLQCAAERAQEQELQVREQTDQQQALTDRLQALSDELDRSEAHVRELSAEREQLTAARDQERADRLRQVDADVTEQAEAATKAERDAARLEVESLSGERDRLQNERDQARQALHDVENHYLNERFRLIHEIEDIRSALSAAQRASESWPRERDRLQNERDQARQAHHQLENRYLDERYELIHELELARDVARQRRVRAEALGEQVRRLSAELARVQEPQVSRPPQPPVPPEPVPNPSPGPKPIQPESPALARSPEVPSHSAATETAPAPAPTEYLDLVLDQWAVLPPAPEREPDAPSESAESRRSPASRA